MPAKKPANVKTMSPASGLEPLLPYELYSELLHCKPMMSFSTVNKNFNAIVVTDYHGHERPLSPAARKVVENSPEMLLAVLGYLKAPNAETLHRLVNALAGSLGISGNARDDYVVKDPVVGL
jgi:hypothetical protein